MTTDGSSCGMAADVAGEAAPLLLPSTRDGERIRKQRHSAPRTTLKQGSGEPGRGKRGRASREILGVRHLLEHRRTPSAMQVGRRWGWGGATPRGGNGEWDMRGERGCHPQARERPLSSHSASGKCPQLSRSRPRLQLQIIDFWSEDISLL
jgi:hypothetical protein